MFQKLVYISILFWGVLIADTALAQETPEPVNQPSDSAILTADISPQSERHERIQKSENDTKSWFTPAQNEEWFNQLFQKADRTWLIEFFAKNNWKPPQNTYALIAPVRIRNDQVEIQYFSFGDTAFDYSMTLDGDENYWPASTVKLTAAVLALVKLHEYNLTSQTIVQFNDTEGHYEGTVEDLCREAIIPSNNTAYNRLMEIAGFDETNDSYLPKVFHYPTMLLQRRYVRRKPGDNIRTSPAIDYKEGENTGTIPLRISSGRTRHLCPRESNCTTLAELAETVFRILFHDYLKENYRYSIQKRDIEMLTSALLEAPSCIKKGVSDALGNDALIYNKGGKVIGDDRLEVGVVSTNDGSEKYLIALSMPYYEGVEEETSLLAKRLILSMQALENE